MFNIDVVALREFYASSLGRGVSVALLKAMRKIWPDCAGDEVVTLGYCWPFLDSFRDDASDIIPLMPGYQGGMAWPVKEPNRVSLINERRLPLKTDSVNRLLVIHTLENSRVPGKLIEELWRILVPGGRALIIVPNRRGLWSQAASTPFGCGQPYSLQQIGKRLGNRRFTLVSYRTCLFGFPLGHRWLLRMAPLMERIGEFLLPESGGVILMEVEKQIYASIPEPVTDEVEEKNLMPALS